MKLDFELNVNRSILNETELAAINTSMRLRTATESHVECMNGQDPHR